MRSIIILFIILGCVNLIYCQTNLSKIKHVIVLMLENRSFDHMLGFLKKLNSNIDGCLPENAELCSNPLNPLDPTSPKVIVDDEAVYVQISPTHSISGTTEQIYGSPDGTDPSMKGFIANYELKTDGPNIMKCFSPEHLPILANLSMEYATFDSWFASVPGPTMVNRAFAASGTSNGMGTNDPKQIALGLPQKTMFKQLLDMGLDYRIYFQEVPTLLMFKDLRRPETLKKFRSFPKLFDDIKDGNLPEFTWLEPRYYDTPFKSATDQHPDHDVSAGEALIKEVYESLRASSLWNESALIITYDEHGGFFDHVSPPTNIPNPDGKNSTDDPFDFTRLGVRVPSVIVSPWVAKGTLLKALPPDQPQYEHSSIIATVVHKLFQPTDSNRAPKYLNKRDSWARTFESVFDTEITPRTDCPLTLPDVLEIRKAFPNSGLPPLGGNSLVSHLQLELQDILAAATNDLEYSEEIGKKFTEAEGAEWCEKKMKYLLKNE